MTCWGCRRVTFQPYTRQQLVEIVLQRLRDAEAVEAFDENAITFAARKVPNTCHPSRFCPSSASSLTQHPTAVSGT